MTETKNLQVLLVDDDEINQLVACTFLKKWNVGVTVAKNGAQALDAIAGKRFQLVMMDLHMPGMDGFECTRRIREMSDPYFRNIPIILFSASGLIDTKRSATELGMTDFMNKPFRQEELKAKLSAYLPLPVTTLRPLQIDFEAHTGGDRSFKSELLHLLIENLNELKRSLDVARATNDAVDFRKTAHKVSSAFGILNDAELADVFARLKALVSAGEWTSPDLKKVASEFEKMVSELVRSMEDEIQSNHRNDLKQT